MEQTESKKNSMRSMLKFGLTLLLGLSLGLTILFLVLWNSFVPKEIGLGPIPYLMGAALCQATSIFLIIFD